jgi:hypothetical protein
MTELVLNGISRNITSAEKHKCLQKSFNTRGRHIEPDPYIIGLLREKL